MEMQVVLIGAVVFFISAVLIYLISAFTMKEKTFEEVIAEQKRAQEEEEQKAKAEKKAEKENKRRFKKKEKQKGDQSPKVAVQQVQEDEHKMVNIELEPEIIEPVEEKPKIRKRDKPSKSILHNKGEKGPVISDDFVEEVVHRGPIPKDDLELKFMHEKKEKPKKEAKPKKSEVDAKPKPVVEEVMRVTEVKVQAAAPPSAEPKSSYNRAG